VPGLIEAAARSDWTYGASILTFAFPMALFVAVAAALYVLYTKPHLVPGHRYNMLMRPITGTAAVRPAAEPGPGPAVDPRGITSHYPGGPESSSGGPRQAPGGPAEG
jgi:hypothetical protein